MDSSPTNINVYVEEYCCSVVPCVNRYHSDSMQKKVYELIMNFCRRMSIPHIIMMETSIVVLLVLLITPVTKATDVSPMAPTIDGTGTGDRPFRAGPVRSGPVPVWISDRPVYRSTGHSPFDRSFTVRPVRPVDRSIAVRTAICRLIG